MARRVGRLQMDRARARQVTLMLAGALGMSENAILNAQSRGATEARRIAFYITRNAFQLSLSRVANAFGRDRSSIAQACRALEDRRDDPAFDDWMERLESSALAAPSPQAHAFTPDPRTDSANPHHFGGQND